MILLDKLIGALMSRRTWVAIGGVLVILFEEVLGLTPEQAQTIVNLLIAWIVGDSLYKTPVLHRKFEVSGIGQSGEAKKIKK